MTLITRNVCKIIWRRNFQNFYPGEWLGSTYRYTSSTTLTKFQLEPAIIVGKCHKNLVECSRKIGVGTNSSNIRNALRGFFRRLFFRESTKNARRGALWYATLEGINVKQFFEFLELPDTFASWFRITELHVWMLLVRLSHDNDAKQIRDALVQAMLADSFERAKAVAPFNKTLKKDMNQLIGEFKMGLFSYDDGLLKSDKELCNALWYFFFDRKCEDPRKLEALISYIRYQINHLQSINTSEIKEENISKHIWTPFSDHFNQK